MKRASLAVTVLVALTLTGCAGTPENAPSEPEQAATSTSEQTLDETPADDAAELTELEQEWVDDETWDTYEIPKDTRLESAELACAEFAAGKTTDQMTLPGVPADLTDFFANSARNWFCPN